MRFAILAATLCLSACASITAGTTQTIAVSTRPKPGATCEIANEKGKWTVNPTPGITTITKAYGALTAKCTHPDGDTGTASVESKTAGAAFGNIIAGGIIGAAVDMSSGAAYIYPEKLEVLLDPPVRPVASRSN